jgi:hypothetical protein
MCYVCVIARQRCLLLGLLMRDRRKGSAVRLFQSQGVGIPHAHGEQSFSVGAAAEQFGVFAALNHDAAIGHFYLHLQAPDFVTQVAIAAGFGGGGHFCVESTGFNGTGPVFFNVGTPFYRPFVGWKQYGVLRGLTSAGF